MRFFGILCLFHVSSRIMGALGSAEATAMATLRVQERLVLKKDKDLTFPDGAIGENEKKIINPNDPESAKFSVTGLGGKSYLVKLPNSIYMIHKRGEVSNQRILVYDFKTNLGQTSSGELDSNGIGNFQVGATREGIKSNQAVGNYEGTFTLRVEYL